MRPFSTIEDKHSVNEPGYEPPVDQPVELDPPERDPPAPFMPNLAGAIIASLGGIIVAIAPFLPLVEPTTVLTAVRGNTLVQSGEWQFVVFGAGVVLAAIAYYTEAKRRYAWSVILLGLLTAGSVVHVATDKSARTLYSLSESGAAEGHGTVVPFALAIYLAGVGALLVLLGGWTMRRGRRS